LAAVTPLTCGLLIGLIYMSTDPIRVGAIMSSIIVVTISILKSFR